MLMKKDLGRVPYPSNGIHVYDHLKMNAMVNRSGSSTSAPVNHPKLIRRINSKVIANLVEDMRIIKPAYVF
jgi:hypothetical protein